MRPRAETTAWEVVPGDSAGADTGTNLQAVAARCRKRVSQRALLAVGVAMVPMPGLDWAVDVGLLMRLLPQISAEFGLSQAQVEQLAPDRRVVVYKAISAAGGALAGRLVTRELVLKMVKMVGCD